MVSEKLLQIKHSKMLHCSSLQNRLSSHLVS